MRTLAELKSKILPVPSLFARAAEDIAQEDDMTSEMNFQSGFSSVFATEDGIGQYLKRRDFNRMGEIASREIHFKEAGGVHTFSHQVVEKLSGYPKQGVLNAYDGYMQTQVESTFENNNVAFCDSEGNLIPGVIDGFIFTSEKEKQKAWHTVSKIYGTHEGLFSCNLDYSRATTLTNGSIINEDSFVIGISVNLIVGHVNTRSFTTNITSPHGTFTQTIWAKGKSGDEEGYWPLIWVTSSGAVTIIKLPTFGYIAGSTNYSMSFFAKKGSTFSANLNFVKNTTTIWTAIPIQSIVEESEND